MRIILASVLFAAALATGATAKPSPFETRPAEPPLADDSVLYLGPAGAMLESDYFGAPQPLAGAGRVFPCRVRLQSIARQPRFAQVCD